MEAMLFALPETLYWIICIKSGPLLFNVYTYKSTWENNIVSKRPAYLLKYDTNQRKIKVIGQIYFCHFALVK